jgi:hypothetical protein
LGATLPAHASWPWKVGGRAVFGPPTVAVVIAKVHQLPTLKRVPNQDYGIWQSIVPRQPKHLKVAWTPTVS